MRSINLLSIFFLIFYQTSINILSDSYHLWRYKRAGLAGKLILIWGLLKYLFAPPPPSLISLAVRVPGFSSIRQYFQIDDVPDRLVTEHYQEYPRFENIQIYLIFQIPQRKSIFVLVRKTLLATRVQSESNLSPDCGMYLSSNYIFI